jgi:hypothetical protein
MTQFDDDDGNPGDGDRERDELVPECWRDECEDEPTLSFDALFGRDDEGADPYPESCRTDPLGEAAAELSLAQRRIDEHFARLLCSLTDAEVRRLEPRDQEVVRAFRALPEREQEVLRARFSSPRHGVAHLLHAGGPPQRRPYESPSVSSYDLHDPHAVAATCKRTGRTLSRQELAHDWQEVLAGNFDTVSPEQLQHEALQRRAEALTRIARQNLGTIVTMERMLADTRALRLVEPPSRRDSEPSSRRAVEFPSRGPQSLPRRWGGNRRAAGRCTAGQRGLAHRLVVP